MCLIDLVMELKMPPETTRLAANRRLPSWREMNRDTSPEVEALLLKLWRETPVWRKLEMMESLNRAARQLALIGLRRRFPHASPAELRWRLAVMSLGEELTVRVLGPCPG